MDSVKGKISINISEVSSFYSGTWADWMNYLKSFGFDCMEIAINSIREREKIEQLSGMLRENDITVSAVHDWFHFFSPNDPDGIREMQDRLLLDLEYTRILGGDRLIWYTGKNDEYVDEAAVDELLKRIEPVLKRAEEMKIILLLETEFVKGGNDPAASVQLLKKLFTKAANPYLACNFDAANLYVAGEEPFPYAYEELKPWIRYMHVKDARELIPGVHLAQNMTGYRQEGRKDCVCCAAGEGGVNMTGLLETLKRDGYDGYASLELHIKNEYQEETLKRTLDFMKKYW